MKGWELFMIRPAVLEDIPAIRLIATITWAQAYESMIPKEIQDQYIKNNYSQEELEERISNSEMIVATEDNLIVGYANYQILDGVVYLLAIYVLPTHQRSGIGSILMNFLCEETKIQADKVIVEVEVGNIMAEKFYLSHDFVKGQFGYGEIMGHPLKTVNYERKL